MSVSGRSSSCSVIQDEGIVKQMHRTPKTPIKNGYQTTPRKSERKRSLFQSNGSGKMDDLGLIRALSPSSSSSTQSLNSPQFSPNGGFSTPPTTPKNKEDIFCYSPKISSKKIEVKSSLFPDLKVHTPKSRRTPRTPRTLVSKECTPDGRKAFAKSFTTPLKKLQRRELFQESFVSETDSSPSVCSLNQDTNEEISDNNISDSPTILGIKPLSCESFYGPLPTSQKVRTRLFIDTIEPGKRNLVRSQSKESLSSNKSFVSGGTRKKSNINGPHCSHHSKSSNLVSRKSSGRNKGIQAGVWHNIKKPKQIKKIKKTEKPLISPASRWAKLSDSSNANEIKIKEKRLFQDNPRKRVPHIRKRSRNDIEEDETLHYLKKKKKLPSPEVRIHPAVSSPENITPDPNKKFLKYGQTRKATFTINQNVKLQLSDGVMKLQSPKKRRKLYSGKKDLIEDFNDFEDADENIQTSIEGILNILEDEKVTKKTEPEGSTILQPKKSPFKKKANSQRSPLKTVSNLPTLIINDFDSDEDDENIDPEKAMISMTKKSNEVTLEKTGNMISLMTNILVNSDQDLNISLNNEFEGNGNENSPPNEDKFYSLFYKQNWNKYSEINESPTTVKTPTNKKNPLIPDDQYLLDAGQESVGIVTCKKCGVMYQAGDFVDEATHNNFHNHLPELKFTGWNNERVVGRYSDGRIIMILSSDPKVWWQKVSKIVEIVDQELGFPEASVQSLFYKTVYLYINDKSKQITGCLIAEDCKIGFKMLAPIEGVEIDSCSKDPTPCKVGISRIWTALSHRRKGIASRMIECLQKTFLFGNIVPLDEIAFSVPSPSGKLLAQKVTGKLDFLVYGFA